jgi:hypothetical protein
MVVVRGLWLSHSGLRIESSHPRWLRGMDAFWRLLVSARMTSVGVLVLYRCMYGIAKGYLVPQNQQPVGV